MVAVLVLVFDGVGGYVVDNSNHAHQMINKAKKAEELAELVRRREPFRGMKRWKGGEPRVFRHRRSWRQIQEERRPVVLNLVSDARMVERDPWWYTLLFWSVVGLVLVGLGWLFSKMGPGGG